MFCFGSAPPRQQVHRAARAMNRCLLRAFSGARGKCARRLLARFAMVNGCRLTIARVSASVALNHMGVFDRAAHGATEQPATMLSGAPCSRLLLAQRWAHRQTSAQCAYRVRYRGTHFVKAVTSVRYVWRNAVVWRFALVVAHQRWRQRWIMIVTLRSTPRRYRRRGPRQPHLLPPPTPPSSPPRPSSSHLPSDS